MRAAKYLVLIAVVLLSPAVLNTAPQDNRPKFINSAILDEDEEVAGYIRSADELVNAGEASAAILLYQKALTTALDQSPHSLVNLKQGSDDRVRRYILAVDYCHRRLAAMDPRQASIYRVRWEADAREMLAEAIKRASTANLVQTFLRYPFTSSGVKSVALAADAAAERGDYPLAAYYYRRAVEAMRTCPSSADGRGQYTVLLAKAARAFSEARSLEGLKEIMSIVGGDIALSRAEIRIAGKTKGLGDFVGDAIKSFKLATPSPIEGWPTLGGDNARGRVMPDPAGEPRDIRWRRGFTYQQKNKVRSWTDDGHSRYIPLLSSLVPTARDGIVYVSTGEKLLALNEENGEEEFIYDPYATYDRGSRTTRVPAEADFCTIADGTAFFVTFVSFSVDGRLTITAGVMHAVDIETGMVKWRAFEDTRSRRRERICSLPVVRGGEVYVETVRLLNSREEYWLLCFDAVTGKLKWRCPLPSGIIRTAQWRLPAYMDVISIEGHTAIISSLSSTISAVDLRTGRLKWVARYHQGGAWIGAGSPWGHARARYWAYNAPIIRNGKVIAARRDCLMLMCFDIETGALLWSRSMPMLAYIAGEDAGKLFVVDKKLIILDTANGKPLHTGEMDLPHPIGHPALTESALYISTRSSLIVYDRKTKKMRELFKWKDKKMNPSSLLVSPSGFYALNYDEIVAFG